MKYALFTPVFPHVGKYCWMAKEFNEDDKGMLMVDDEVLQMVLDDMHNIGLNNVIPIEESLALELTGDKKYLTKENTYPVRPPHHCQNYDKIKQRWKGKVRSIDEMGTPLIVWKKPFSSIGNKIKRVIDVTKDI